MARGKMDVEDWNRRRGKGAIFIGLLIIIIGVMEYYQFSWPLMLIIIGVLLVIFGISRMAK